MAASSTDNKFSISWHDSAWIPILNSENVLDYFCQRSNTFYDKTCNNEQVKMQRLEPTQLDYMTGVEYRLIHGQDPILYVIRKQMRHSPNQTTHLALYYILAGIVYQAPDVGSMINSRLLSSIHKLQSAFEEAQSYSHYNPSKGYWWVFKDGVNDKPKAPPKKNKAHEVSSLFQRQRVDMLLANFAQNFPPKMVQEKEKNETSENTEGDGSKSKETKMDSDTPDIKIEAAEPMETNGNDDKNAVTQPPSKRKKRE